MAISNTTSPLTVSFAQHDGVGIITFNRPPVNAYEIVFQQQFNAAIQVADADPATRVVIIRSTVPRFFCAGADIKVFTANSSEINREMVDTARAALARMEASGKPFIACIEGHALGGGLEIAMACDLRIAAHGDYKLGLPEVQLGLIPGNGGTQRLSRLVGASRAFELLVASGNIGLEEAYRIGLINQLIVPEQFQECVNRLTQSLTKGAPLAISAAKRTVQKGIALKLADALKLEAHLVDQLYETHDAKEGFAAAVQKRQPAFNGT